MASEQESDQEHTPGLFDDVPERAPLDILATDDRLVVLERSSKTHTRHLSQLEGALFNQMITLSALEVAFALFLAVMIWSEYRRRTEEVRRGADQS